MENGWFINRLIGRVIRILYHRFVPYNNTNSKDTLAINNIFNKNVLFSYITVPPHKPNIIDERGTVPAVAGPYEEGGDMKLQCLVSGGEFPYCFLFIFLPRVKNYYVRIQVFCINISNYFQVITLTIEQLTWNRGYRPTCNINYLTIIFSTKDERLCTIHDSLEETDKYSLFHELLLSVPCRYKQYFSVVLERFLRSKKEKMLATVYFSSKRYRQFNAE